MVKYVIIGIIVAVAAAKLTLNRLHARRINRLRIGLLRVTNQFFCERVGLIITNGEEVSDEELTPEQLEIKEQVNRVGLRVAKS